MTSHPRFPPPPKKNMEACDLHVFFQRARCRSWAQTLSPKNALSAISEKETSRWPTSLPLRGSTSWPVKVLREARTRMDNMSKRVGLGGPKVGLAPTLCTPAEIITQITRWESFFYNVLPGTSDKNKASRITRSSKRRGQLEEGSSEDRLLPFCMDWPADLVMQKGNYLTTNFGPSPPHLTPPKFSKLVFCTFSSTHEKQIYRV